MAFTVYAIKSKVDKRIYVGLTNELERRLKEHNLGHTKSTRAYKPWFLIYQEMVETRDQARKREKYFKSGCGKEFLKTI
jgi:putative endonuclease